MSRKLRMACPLCMVLLFVLVFSVLSMNTRAASGSRDVEKNTSVTFTAESWTSNGVAAGATALEASASLKEDEIAKTENSDSDSQKDSKGSGYTLSDADRIGVECIVMCEAGGEGPKGQMMVAQCILEGLRRYNFTLDEYISYYKVFSTSYSRVTDEVKESVSRVFDDGERVIEQNVDLWYNPALVTSEWHEEQEYVTTVGSHRFFWMIDHDA